MPLRLAAALLAFLIPALASAQALSPDQAAVQYLQANWSRHGLALSDVADLVVADQRTGSRSGVTAVYVHQQVAGAPVVAGQMTISVLADGRVLHAAGRLVPGLASKIAGTAASLLPAQAADALARDRGLTPTEAFQALDQLDGRIILSDGGVSEHSVAARLVYQDDGAGRIVPAWEVGIYTLDAQHFWNGYVDARTGRVLLVEDHVVHDTWGHDAAQDRHAHAPAPAEVVVPAMLPVPHADAFAAGGASYRVYALPLESPVWGTPAPPADARVLVGDPSTSNGSPFGWHDTNGAAGAEFTVTRGNNVYAYPDANADNQPDATGIPDGGASLLFDHPINLTQAPSAYRPAAVTNLFYWNNVFHDVMYNYGFDEAAGNFQTNNYGRGGNVFDDAVYAEAQDGSGTTNANFYTPNDLGVGPLGPRPRMQMYIGDIPTPDSDGDFDNGVILHEYGHGVSNRLTGGPLNVSCLQNAEQMGEGWSDYFGLILTMQAGDTATKRRPIGNYLLGQAQTGGGIRSTPYQPAPGAPYSTDFAINSATYGDTNGGLSAPHGVGFVWTTILWEMTWELIGAHGWSSEIYDADGTAGNQIALNLVMEGMRLQPCSPGFVDGRNAILAADQALYNGAHTSLLWAAFARRGLGIGASQGSSSSRSDQVEDFAEPETIAPSAITNLAALPNGDFVTLTFTATGDDGTVGTASGYDVRYSTTPITDDATFNAATQMTGEPLPQAAGAAESFVLPGLTFTQTYYVAMKVSDNSFNTSSLSNVVQVTTLGAPVAAYPAASVQASVTQPGQTTTADFVINNTGPSDLRYTISLAEAARRGAAVQPEVGAPGPEASKNAPEAPGAAAERGRGGPDAFGYSWIDSNEPGGPTFAWVDIATTGTAVTLGDDAAVSVPLPFAFPYYGTDRTSVRIVSNGWLGFAGSGTSTAFTNAAIPTAGAPNDMLAAFWDDLNPSSGGSVRYQNMGDGRFVVSWLGVPRYSDAPSVMTFQIILYANGQIVYQYQSMTGTLNSATVGIENPNGTDGLQVAYNAPYVANNLAVRFSALWVDAAPSTGLVPAGGSGTVTLTFDAGGLTNGTYQAVMAVATNDPTQPTTNVPVTFDVGVTVADEGTDAFDGTHRLSNVSPNPASGVAFVSLAVAEAQTVRAELYDALGRRVATVFDGAVGARETVRLTAAPAGLAAGTYVLRVAGETFSDARRLTVAR